MNLPVGYRVPSSDITKMSYFAVLDSDDSGNEGPKPKAKAPAKASAAAPGASQAPAPAPSKEGPKKEKQAANGGSKPKGDRPPRSDKPKEDRPPRQPRAAAAAGESAEGEVGKDNARGGVDGHRRGKDGDRRRGNNHRRKKEGEEGDKPPRKREFERRSGTGRGREVAKDGRGPFGAGNVNQEAQDAEKDPSSADAPAEGSAEEDEVEVAPPAEPEPPTRSLDEFLALRNSSRNNKELFGAKETREVSIKDVEGIGRIGGDTLTDFMVLSKKSSGDKQKKGSQPKKDNALLEAAFSIKGNDDAPREERRDGGRGGRGSGDRGGRGGDKGTGSRSPRSTARIDFQDANAFPSL